MLYIKVVNEETQYSNNSIKTQEKEKGNLGSLVYPIPSHSEPQDSCKTHSPTEPPTYHLQRAPWRRAVLTIHVLINVLGHSHVSGREY